MQGMNPNRQSTIDVPVRILVPSESVGAIIGKGGQTIRQLTQQTRAKVDVYRGDPMAPTSPLQEKVITIRGQPENCINACREILKVMKQDSESKGKTNDLVLKVLAHNDYIGRIIGKQGNIINSIKKDTDTTVTVSSINDISMNVERVITVKGELENMIKALEIIHQKIKSAFENDTKTYGPQAIMMTGGMPPMAMPTPAYAPYPPGTRFPGQPNAAPAPYSNYFPQIFPPFYQQGFVAPPPPPPHPAAAASLPHPGAAAATTPVQQQQQQGAAGITPNAGVQTQQQPQQQQQQQQGATGNEYATDAETVYLYIPNLAVGAIIGTKGQFIKNIIKHSGASVKITPLSPEESKNATERQVVILGSRDSQYRAQYCIFEKIRCERYSTDDAKLRVEINVPSQIVGRIIGKSGKNVRDLQRQTGATIKLPEDANQTQSSHVVVRIFGNFNSSQAAQNHIQGLIASSLRGPGSRSNPNIAGGVQIQNVMMNNNTRTQNGNGVNRGPNNNNNKRQYQQQQQQAQQNGQPQSQQQTSGNSSTANSTPTATTPTSTNVQTEANTSINNNENQQQPPAATTPTGTPTTSNN